MPGPVSDSYEGPGDDKPPIPAWALKPLGKTTSPKKYRTLAQVRAAFQAESVRRYWVVCIDPGGHHTRETDCADDPG